MTILYIDDDADDREMLNSALRAVNPSVDVSFAVNGRAGLHFLQKAKDDNALPCLVVLDINMPVLDGKKTLELIRQDPGLQQLPVVIFTSSENHHDQAYFQMQAADFISKPFSPSALSAIARRLLQYCL
jgi:CheY-like chemotaxis protein